MITSNTELLSCNYEVCYSESFSYLNHVFLHSTVYAAVYVIPNRKQICIVLERWQRFEFVVTKADYVQLTHQNTIFN